jgi:DnaJ-class molecular chaperone
MNKQLSCPFCDGTGKQFNDNAQKFEKSPCKQCNGTGKYNKVLVVK